MVASGACECAMALGFEKMAAGSLAAAFSDRTNPLDKTLQSVGENGSSSHGPFAARVFGSGGEEYCRKYGATWRDIASIAAKVSSRIRDRSQYATILNSTTQQNHRHSTRNPYSQFQNAISVDEVLTDKKVSGEVSTRVR